MGEEARIFIAVSVQGDCWRSAASVHPLQRGIDRNLNRPGIKTGLSAEPLQVLEGIEKCLLQDVFCILGVFNNAIGDLVDTPFVKVDQRFKPVSVT